MRKIFFTIAISVTASLSFSQKNEEVVFISNLVEKPKELSILSLELPIWHLTGSMVNFSLYDLKSSLTYVGSGKINGGATFNWKVGDKIMPETYERIEYVNHNMVMSKYNASAAQSLDVWGTYFFKESIEPTEQTIRLKKVGNTIYVTNVDTKEYKRTGLTLGYSQGFSWYNMNNMNLSVASIATPDITETIDMNSMSTVRDFKEIKAGVTITKAVNFKVDVDGYGTKKGAHLTMNTFNAIFAVQNDFDNVLVGRINTSSNQVEFSEYSLTDDNKKLPIGFEWRHKTLTKSWFSYEYGVGYYPGLLKKINIGVHFGASVNIDFLRNKGL